MNDSNGINPYAPSHVENVSLPSTDPDAPRSITTSTVYWTTYLYVCVSGGLFGVVVMLFGAITSRAQGDSVNELLPSPVFAVIVVFVFGVGFFIAAIAGIVGVSIVMMSFSVFGLRPASWSLQRLLIFGALSGFLSGYVSLAAFGVDDLEWLWMGFMPAGLALVTVPALLYIFFIRKRQKVSRRQTTR